MKIGNQVACRARHRHRRAPAQMVRIEKSARTVIGANPRELRNLRKDGAFSRLKLRAPNVGIISITRFENYRRAARAPALEIHFAPSADVDKTAKITRRGD